VAGVSETASTCSASSLRSRQAWGRQRPSRRPPYLRQRGGEERIGFIPEQPKTNGVASDLDLSTNLALKRIWRLDWFNPLKGNRADSEQRLQAFDVRPERRPTARTLSGGTFKNCPRTRARCALRPRGGVLPEHG